MSTFLGAWAHLRFSWWTFGLLAIVGGTKWAGAIFHGETERTAAWVWSEFLLQLHFCETEERAVARVATGLCRLLWLLHSLLGIFSKCNSNSNYGDAWLTRKCRNQKRLETNCICIWICIFVFVFVFAFEEEDVPTTGCIRGGRKTPCRILLNINHSDKTLPPKSSHRQHWIRKHRPTCKKNNHYILILFFGALTLYFDICN